jgi:hypothetical protein
MIKQLPSTFNGLKRWELRLPDQTMLASSISFFYQELPG